MIDKQMINGREREREGGREGGREERRKEGRKGGREEGMERQISLGSTTKDSNSENLHRSSRNMGF